jgi:hypothetical protein
MADMAGYPKDADINPQLELGESGDGSDRDLDELIQQAIDRCWDWADEKCSNPGMQVMAQMCMPAVVEMAEQMHIDNGCEEPQKEPLFDGIDGVHSYDTANSCMHETIDGWYKILFQAWEMIVAHEAAEGQGPAVGSL